MVSELLSWINIQRKEMWLKSFEYFVLCFILIYLFMVLIHKRKDLNKVLPFLLLLILCSIAYRFGSSGNIFYKLSSSMIFLVAAFMSFLIIINNEIRLFLLQFFSFIIISLLAFQVTTAYKEPYRLATSIELQNNYVNLLGGIYVDTVHKEYLYKLLNVRKEYNGKFQHVIDFTGATPGINVILDKKFFGTGWLLGGKKSSSEFVYRALSPFSNLEEFKRAWILTAPNGKRKIKNDVLELLNINLNKDYEIVLKLKKPHNNEIQYLWKPR